MAKTVPAKAIPTKTISTKSITKHFNEEKLQNF